MDTAILRKVVEKVRATIPKGIVGGFEFTTLQSKLKEWHKSPWNVCLRVLKESNKSIGSRATMSGTVY